MIACKSCGRPEYDPDLTLVVEDDYISFKIDDLEVMKIREITTIDGAWSIDADIKVGNLSYHTEGFQPPATLPPTICEVCKR